MLKFILKFSLDVVSTWFMHALCAHLIAVCISNLVPEMP